jgi:hypothetical protein
MKKRKLPTIVFAWMIIMPVCKIFAQPYIDIANVRLIKSPDMGTGPKTKNATVVDYFNISTTLPLFLKNKKDAIVLNPFFEKWSTTVANVNTVNQYHYSIALPVSLLKSIPNSSWTLLTTGIIRMNDVDINKNGKWQFGGALLAANYRKEKNLTYKIGLYVNAEFFGLFIIPLLGIDWRINEKTNLFGVLPASLTLERKLNNHFYSGATFRTFTNSYHDSAQTYFRIDENQLGLFVDYYINKHIVLNLEAGHSLFRKIRSGVKHEESFNWNASDNFYFKMMLAFRIRTR